MRDELLKLYENIEKLEKKLKIARDTLEYLSTCDQPFVIGIINGGEYIMLGSYCKRVLEQIENIDV